MLHRLGHAATSRAYDCVQLARLRETVKEQQATIAALHESERTLQVAAAHGPQSPCECIPAENGNERRAWRCTVRCGLFWLRWLCDGASELGVGVWCSFHCQEQIRRLSGLHGDAQALP